jgi:hypothetical protein
MLVLQALDDFPEAQWDQPGACGSWSVKDTVAHLTSYEQLLVEVLHSVQQGEEPPAYVTQILHNTSEFNQQEVAKRQYQTAQQVLNEFDDAQVQVSSLLKQIPEEELERKGTLPWFRADLSLANLLNGFGEHARKHSEQIIKFRKQNKQSLNEQNEQPF